MSEPEAIELKADEQATSWGESRVVKANERVSALMFGAQKLMFEEFVFASNELIERTQTEMHLFSELMTKMAGAHSVKDIRTMYEECSKHQLDFIRRDCNRVFEHGKRVIETTSDLIGHAL